MRVLSRVGVALCGCVVAATMMIGFAPSASAAYSPTPIGPAWSPAGPVHAVLAAGDRVYIGGAFTGGVAALDASTGALIKNYTLDGDVRALALAPNGTDVIAGGAFTHADGATHRKLALLHPDGTTDPGWKGSAGGTVRDIVVVGDTVYFGGLFTQHDGVTQGGLGAVNVSTGKVDTSFTTSTNAKVYALETNGLRLFIAGDFTAVDGQPRNSMASVTLLTRSLDTWNPSRACTNCNVYWDIVLDGPALFAASRNAGAVTANDIVDGRKLWSKPTTANGDAQALTVSDGDLYVGGHFVKIPSNTAKVPGGILAKLSEATGAVDTTFRPKFVTTYPGIWALDATSSHLYVGGAFTAAGPTPPPRYPYFAIFGSI